MLFQIDNRAQVTEELKAHGLHGSGAVVSKLAEMWRGLGDAEKEVYQARGKVSGAVVGGR